jgi:hypothetical protein
VQRAVLHAVAQHVVRAFLQATQPKVAQVLDLGQDGPTRRQFLARLQGEIMKRGTIKTEPPLLDVTHADGRCRTAPRNQLGIRP